MCTASRLRGARSATVLRTRSKPPWPKRRNGTWSAGSSNDESRRWNGARNPNRHSFPRAGSAAQMAPRPPAGADAAEDPARRAGPRSVLRIWLLLQHQPARFGHRRRPARGRGDAAKGIRRTPRKRARHASLRRPSLSLGGGPRRARALRLRRARAAHPRGATRACSRRPLLDHRSKPKGIRLRRAHWNRSQAFRDRARSRDAFPRSLRARGALPRAPPPLAGQVLYSQQGGLPATQAGPRPNPLVSSAATRPPGADQASPFAGVNAPRSRHSLHATVQRVLQPRWPIAFAGALLLLGLAGFSGSSWWAGARHSPLLD